MPGQLQIPITIGVDTWQSRYEAFNDSFWEQDTGAHQEPNLDWIEYEEKANKWRDCQLSQAQFHLGIVIRKCALAKPNDAKW
jgi:hypothetical protein